MVQQVIRRLGYKQPKENSRGAADTLWRQPTTGGACMHAWMHIHERERQVQRATGKQTSSELAGLGGSAWQRERGIGWWYRGRLPCGQRCSFLGRCAAGIGSEWRQRAELLNCTEGCVWLVGWGWAKLVPAWPCGLGLATTVATVDGCSVHTLLGGLVC